MASKIQLMKKMSELMRDSDQTVETMLEGVEAALGVVPLVAKGMSKRPEVFIPSTIAEGFMLKFPKALNMKTAELIAVAAAAALRSEGCLDVHMKAALNAGATMDEIYDVIVISGLMAQTSRLGTAFRVYEKYEKEK
jgi:AhpD family alkylhydroperoxidase